MGLSTSSLASIQAALDAAQEGNTVWVGPGTYLEYELTYQGTALTLASTHFSSATYIDAGGLGRVMTFESAEGPASVLDGFTLTGGYLDGETGAGLFVSGSSPTITNCTFTANEATHGGGMALWYGDPAITNCVIEGNTAEQNGGGLYPGGLQPAGRIL